jgi:hypothetical protein
LLEGSRRGERYGKKDKEPGPNCFLLLSEPLKFKVLEQSLRVSQIPVNSSKLSGSCIM